MTTQNIRLDIVRPTLRSMLNIWHRWHEADAIGHFMTARKYRMAFGTAQAWLLNQCLAVDAQYFWGESWGDCLTHQSYRLHEPQRIQADGLMYFESVTPEAREWSLAPYQANFDLNFGGNEVVGFELKFAGRALNESESEVLTIPLRSSLQQINQLEAKIFRANQSWPHVFQGGTLKHLANEEH
jgi:hypothetical protein